MVTNDTEQTVEDALDWQDIPGAAATVTAMTSWGGGLVLAHFFSDRIRGCQAGNPCFLRILVDGVEADPALPAVWNSDSPEPHFIDRALAVEPGRHTVQVQVLTAEGGVHFILDDWGLRVEVARGP